MRAFLVGWMMMGLPLLALAEMVLAEAALAESATLSWDDNVNSVVIERQLNGGPWAIVDKVAPHVTSYTDPTLARAVVDNVYGYRLYALSETQSSAPTYVLNKTIARLDPVPMVPPLASISVPVPATIAVWTLGAASSPPGNFWIMRNGVRVLDARGSKIALCGSAVYVLGRDKVWWRWTGNAWLTTNAATLVCP